MEGISMKRVLLYARYSSDQQSATSIADQQRLCREYVEKCGWQIAGEYSDAAISGATLLRPGFQALMRVALAGSADVVLAESLDRFSRNLEDTAGLFRRLTFAGVSIVTVAQGDIGPLHVGFQGTINEMYLADLAQKTRRGLRGRVEAGLSGGGLCYGYHCGATTGEREIDPVEAAVVRRIFRQYADHVSPKAIAKALNKERVPGPRSRGRECAWSPSTIHGHAGRGTGVLNNELYIGRRVWNRQRYVKDPDTGKRLARVNPTEQWIVKDVPHLRILDDELWQAAKSRQQITRRRAAEAPVKARPKYLFSGLTRCGSCGGGFILSSRGLLRCFNASARGICTNTRAIKREEVEARVLRAMRERFFEPGAFAAFCEGFTAELAAQRREHLASMGDARHELAAIGRRQEDILQAFTAGLRSEGWKDELLALDARKAELMAALAEPPLLALHPHMAHVFRRKATALAAGLEDETHRDAAREALRGFLDRIVIPPGDELLQVVGNVGQMLTAAQGRSTSARAVGLSGCGGGI